MRIKRIVTLLTILATMFICVLLWLNHNLNQQTLQTATKPFVGWKTYDNPKYGYQFEYPSNLIVAGGQDRVSLITPTGNHIYFSADSDTSSTIAQYLAKTDKFSQTAWENSPSIRVKTTKKTVINGLNCIQRVEDDLAVGLESTNTYFKNNMSIVISTFMAIPADDSASDEQTYSQILSTFKFIETVAGFQTNTCCSCPTKINKSLIGTDGWVIYQKGKNYSQLLPKSCDKVYCAPCPPED